MSGGGGTRTGAKRARLGQKTAAPAALAPVPVPGPSPTDAVNIDLIGAMISWSESDSRDDEDWNLNVDVLKRCARKVHQTEADVSKITVGMAVAMPLIAPNVMVIGTDHPPTLTEIKAFVGTDKPSLAAYRAELYRRTKGKSKSKNYTIGRAFNVLLRTSLLQGDPPIPEKCAAEDSTKPPPRSAVSKKRKGPVQESQTAESVEKLRTVTAKSAEAEAAANKGSTEAKIARVRLFEDLQKQFEDIEEKLPNVSHEGLKQILKDRSKLLLAEMAELVEA